MSTLKKAWTFTKKWWWAILGGLLFVASWIVSATLRKPVRRTEDIDTPKSTGESLREMARREAELAETDILIEKAKADTKVEEERKRLDSIKKETDPKRRRKRLAKWASQNI